MRSWADCVVCDPAEDARKVAEVLGFRTSTHVTREDFQTVNGVILAIKPHLMDGAAAAIGPLLPPGALVISVAAGLDLARLAKGFANAHIVRAMPNAAAAVGESMTVFVADDQVTPAQRQLAETLLSALGNVEQTSTEKDMDAVTAVSGSGPAYVYLLTEALTDAGVRAGLSAEFAAKLARQTVVGAGKMLDMLPSTPEDLRAAVTSPGGTTQAALAVLDGQDGLRNLMADAVAAAVRRGRELNQ